MEKVIDCILVGACFLSALVVILGGAGIGLYIMLDGDNKQKWPDKR